MQIYKFPSEDEWAALLSRPALDNAGLMSTVSNVLDDVRARGDEAVREYGLKFDKVEIGELQATPDEFKEAERNLPNDLKQAIFHAQKNIAKFHAAQDTPLPTVETMAGVTCWQRAMPISKVGLYVPGGTAPLFSTVLMLAVPARIAGCKEIVLCTPPDKEGKVHPAVLFAAQVAGVNKVFKIGGVQAIGAMAYGTESVPKVYKIFGPGNQYVTAAKQAVSLRDVAIDMPAGPSEVEVLADHTANPAFVAADMLSQAEHGPDSQAILITTCEPLARQVMDEVEKQLAQQPRLEYTRKSLSHSRLIVVRDIRQAIDLTNAYAPEHLIIQTEDYRAVADKIENAGSLFLGHLTPESAGDYASGTNHTLPTSGYAHAYSGVNLDSFRKKMTYQEITPEGIGSISTIVETMAENEHLIAHRDAMRMRRLSVEKQ